MPLPDPRMVMVRADTFYYRKTTRGYKTLGKKIARIRLTLAKRIRKLVEGL